ncbi:MAG TPA: hypothetical protein VGB71_14845 [Flavisolibacter sp.]|jgi:hypothetical protein
MNPKHKKVALAAAALPLLLVLVYAFAYTNPSKPSVPNEHISCTPERHVCVMKTMFNLEEGPRQLKSFTELELPAEAKASIKSGLSWMAGAQLPDGGWGAGFHAQQDLRDPHAVTADPATTSLVLLSLLRTGNSLDSGTYQKQVIKATEFLLKKVETWPLNQPRLTTLTGTQPQQKLGENIDAILTVQYLTTLLKYHQGHAWKDRIQSALQKCVSRIEKEQDTDGGWKGGGWAPVLQSALADQALEEAKDAGITVDSTVLAKSKSYQKGNFDTATNSAVTGKAAGVMLYSLSSTTRSSAKEAGDAKKIVAKAKKDGKLKEHDKVTEESLVAAGVSSVQAKGLVTAYNINESTKRQSMQANVMEGFGSNGGEELISYLMTGESIRLQGGQEWKQWYDGMMKKMITIQKADGSWEGHHCITSPVFCTAAALLLLSIQNDLGVSFEKSF